MRKIVMASVMTLCLTVLEVAPLQVASAQNYPTLRPSTQKQAGYYKSDESPFKWRGPNNELYDVIWVGSSYALDPSGSQMIFQDMFYQPHYPLPDPQTFLNNYVESVITPPIYMCLGKCDR